MHTPGTQKNGNYEASLSALCMLLEHVLRAALINDEDTDNPKIVKATRNNSKIELGCSPRATLNLVRGCQAYAAINGRDYVIENRFAS